MAEPLTNSCGTKGFHRTPVENHWFELCKKYTTVGSCESISLVAYATGNRYWRKCSGPSTLKITWCQNELISCTICNEKEMKKRNNFGLLLFKLLSSEIV